MGKIHLNKFSQIGKWGKQLFDVFDLMENE